ncbi:beta-ketoacyl synthase N-terminal-like domain-containing protein [Nostoc sp. DSM 114167]|jgi:acyl transferase domain-containing protein/acyl-CoA synthetase (AMP-forming)/AMP-acid ligase II/acyl carrier protein/SAM-dependent methyltransferase|uniref:beta-ketoacyl synthase N-terminal-like domain-containing protein n=1 Tax=Nostoc sp. DSM 114167 TaxID=3439050 RepID=UPI0040455077
MEKQHTSQTLVDVLRYRAIEQPQTLGYTFLVDGESEGSRLTYRALDKQARAIATYLQTFAKPGDRVLLLYPPGLEFITAFFGCLYAGTIAIPAYPPRQNQSIARLGAIVSDAQATAILTTTALLPIVKNYFADNPGLASLKVLASDGISEAIAQEWQAPNINGNTLAFLQYTSGSTGMPKGVMVSHSNLLHNLAYIDQGWNHTANSVMVTWIPFFHDMGLIYGVLQPLYYNFPSYIMAPVSFIGRPIRWLQAISRYQATHSSAPNFAYELCLRKITAEQRASLNLSSWQVASNGAEPVKAETLQRFAKAFASCGFQETAFCPAYGLAEATLKVTTVEAQTQPIIIKVEATALAENRVMLATAEDSKTRLLVGCGNSQQGDTQIAIAHPELLRRCLPDEVGEIWVAGASITQGYWQRYEETKHTFAAYLADTGEGPFLRTGDLGFLQDGELFITGRLKDLIIIRGHNHYPQDIELTVTNSHSALGLQGVAAFTIEVDGEEQLVVACEVERTAMRKLDASEVIGCIRQAVTTQHELEVYAVLLLKPVSIPKTSSGKIQRYATRARFLAGTLEVVGQWRKAGEQVVTERSRSGSSTSTTLSDRGVGERGELRSRKSKDKGAAEIQHWLVNKIAQRQNVAPQSIDPHESFAYYGLDSIAAVSLSADLEDWLGCQLLPTLAYDYPTIATLSAYLTENLSQRRESPQPRQNLKSVEAIAIIGLDCRFPGANNPEAFWQLLRNGESAIDQIPANRWDSHLFYNPIPAQPGKMSTRWGGFIEQVDQFDPQFFGISPREAERMDPQQRLLLEVSWQALENAGLASDRLTGSNSGVFIGISTNDYARFQFDSLSDIDVYASTGNALSIAANRLSYQFDWHGPSWAVDTACSSSLVAVHQACQSLRLGECDLALAGGVNLILTPQMTIALSQARFMSGDGRCKTFDADADGYVRGEGCGIVMLKRLTDAIEDGDNILALIRGSAVNQDGRSNGLTAPRGIAQQSVIHQALVNAGVAPAAISYVEAHGTGTALGDPIEVNSLQSVLMSGRSPNQPCAIGSVKTNIGHLESAAGIAGLIKVVLALQHQEIPGTLHLQQLNPKITIQDTPFSIPCETQKWSGFGEQRFAGVSSFGFGGTNAHVVLEEAPTGGRGAGGRGQGAGSRGAALLYETLHERLRSVTEEQGSILRLISATLNDQRSVTGGVGEHVKSLLTLSAKSEIALRELARRYVAFLEFHSEVSLRDICYTSNVGRSHFHHRLALVAESSEEFCEELAAFIYNSPPSRTGDRCQGVAFLFTGQGSQYIGMGQELYNTQLVFRQAIERCAEILQPYLNQPLLEVLYPSSELENPTQASINETAYTQPALFALEYALSQLWQSWGIKPSVVMGHSIGEYVAATVAGVFSLEDGLKLIAARGRLMQALPSVGAMVAVFAQLQEVSSIIDEYSDLAIAAMNGAHLIVSGGSESMTSAVARLEAKGVKTKALEVSHAFHSPLMQPMLAEFEQIVRQVNYCLPNPDIRFISNLTGQLAASEIATPEYWVQHVMQPVRFADGMVTLAELGTLAYLEVGPQPILLGMGRQCLPSNEYVWLPSLKKEANSQQMLCSLATLYESGISVDWVGFHHGSQNRRVVLPNYPFERSRFWMETASNDVTAKESLCSPAEIKRLLVPQLAELTAQLNLKNYGEALSTLESLSILYVVAAFRQMGWNLQLGDRYSIPQLTKLGVIEQHQKLALRLLEMLVEEGILQRIGNQWEVTRILELPTPQAQLDNLRSQYPQANAELTLLERCGSHLAQVLQGETRPLELLFPQGDLTALTQLYQDSPGAKVMNALVQKAISTAISTATVSILEIGAGTGGTTAYLLPHLPAERTEYVFTDLGTWFTAKAQEKFRDYPFIRYQSLDIEQDPQSQGFTNHQYDIIVAANVLHATEDLQQTLRHVRSLLAPGGLLVLLEGTSPRRWLDLVFGLTPGWWKFSDYELRPFYPLLAVSDWLELLSDCGFQEAVHLAPDCEAIGDSFQQVVILAQSISTDNPVNHNHLPSPVATTINTPQSTFLQSLLTKPPRVRQEELITHVRSLVAKVLGLKQPQSIGLQQGFFELGMDSLTATELKDQLQNSLGCSLSPTTLFDYPTVAALANYLETQVLSLDPQASAQEANSNSESVQQQVLLKESSLEKRARLSSSEQSLDEIADLLAAKLASIREGKLL